MRKLGKFLLVIVVLGGIGYGVFTFFLSPTVNNDKLTLTASFLDNITDATVCESHFNPNTISLCESFQTTMGSTSFTHTEVAAGSNVVSTITISGNDESFTFSFIEEENTGLGAFLNATNYYIDLIE